MVKVLKTTGEQEEFSKEKIIQSVKRAGVPDNLQGKVLKHVEEKLYENIPTSQVYHHVTEYLNNYHPVGKQKYGLKQAIMAMGPSGHPFEDYVAEILKTMDYETQVRSLLKGNCVTHEIDVIAEKDNRRIMVEAKFHNDPGIRTDVHVALYTKARFDDIKEKHNLNQAWLVTNTKLTPDALAYALCVEMDVLSWNYPQGKSLREIVEPLKLYPVTIFSSLSQSQIQILIENHIVLISEILQNKDCLDLLEIQSDKKGKIIEEAKQILS